MKNILFSLSLLWVLAIATTACNTNNLRQENAEKTIREFLATNPIPNISEQPAPADAALLPDSLAISFGTVNQFAEHKSSLRAWLATGDSAAGKGLALRFIFHRKPNNQWLLERVQNPEENDTEILSAWIKQHQPLNIEVQ